VATSSDSPHDAEASRTALLADLGVALAEAGNVGEMLQRLADAAREVSNARYAAIGVLNRDGTGIADFITSGVDEQTRERIGDLPAGRGLLGAIINEKKLIRVDDIASDPRSVGFPPGHPPMSNFLGVPIRLAGRTYGNIYVTDRQQGDGFSDDDGRLLETLAAYAAIAIRGAQLREERLRWIEGLEGVCGISGAISRTLDLPDLLSEVTRRTRALLDCDTVGIGLETDGMIRFPFAHGPNALRLEALDTRDIEVSSLGAHVERALPDHNCLAAELAVGGRSIGALVAVCGGGFDSWQQSVVDVLSSHVATAVANAEQFAEERRRLLEQSDRRVEELEARLSREVQARALLAQEDERARVARELHDETGQLLTGVNLRLKALVSRVGPEAATELSELQEHVKNAQDSMRQILRRLRPVDLERGLGHAIRELAQRANEASDCEVNVQMAPLPPIAGEVELVLFRVCQEALTNVARHSGASHAAVVLTALDQRVRMTIEDDGVGFDVEARTGRLGLSGVAERVELVGGTLRITSSPGAGTAIVVDVAAAPLLPEEEAS